MNNTPCKFAAILLIAGSNFLSPYTSSAATSDAIAPLAITISSSKTLSGVAGDYVTVTGEVKNVTSKTMASITTYLSLVDRGSKLPVDLEDWSAEKGLFIGTIEPGQTLPLEWKIHFVKAGSYTVSIIGNIEGVDRPAVSVLTYFKVKQKQNLNPGQVLPVALGEPVFLLILFALLNYSRNRKVSA